MTNHRRYCGGEQCGISTKNASPQIRTRDCLAQAIDCLHQPPHNSDSEKKKPTNEAHVISSYFLHNQTDRQHLDFEKQLGLGTGTTYNYKCHTRFLIDGVDLSSLLSFNPPFISLFIFFLLFLLFSFLLFSISIDNSQYGTIFWSRSKQDCYLLIICCIRFCCIILPPSLCKQQTFPYSILQYIHH